MSFTPEELAVLKEADKLISRSANVPRVRRGGRQPEPLDPATKAKALEMHKAGVGWRRIRAVLRLSHERIKREMGALYVPLPSTPRKQDILMPQNHSNARATGERGLP